VPPVDDGFVEEEIRELLTKQGFDGANAPVIRGSGLKALEAKDMNDEWAKKIMELTDALDNYIPVPERDTSKPFLMPIEDIFSIEGRGTVVTGKIERGIVKVGEEVEIVGIKPTSKTTITGIEMFNKTLNEGFFSPLQYGHYFLNQETVAQGDGYQHNPGYIEGGSIHTLLRLEDAKKYRANLRVGSYLETWKKLVIIKCFVKLEDFVAIGETVLDYISYQNSLCFKKVTPVEIINEQVSEL
jgi:hypothetical protein